MPTKTFVISNATLSGSALTTNRGLRNSLQSLELPPEQIWREPSLRPGSAG